MEPIVVNIPKEISATRYNGGWMKSVTGLDKTKNNGYSLLGDFVGEGLQPLQPGLYLVCDIGGSRKNQVKTYTLVVLHTDSSVETIVWVQDNDWAVQLWKLIDEYFAAQTAPDTKREALEAEATELRARLAEIEAELAAL